MRILLLVAFVVAACGPTGGGGTTVDPTARPTPEPTAAPWPADYQNFVCAAFDELTDASVHLGEMAEAAGTFDLDVLIEEANAAGQDAREASDFLEVTPDWAPGTGLKKWLGITAENLRTAANLAVFGAENVDTETLDEASALFEKVNSNTGQVLAEIEKLRSETGFSCP